VRTPVLKAFTVEGGKTFDRGGGILNDGTLRVDHLVVRDNESPFSNGGGIASTGDLEVHATVVANNNSEGVGGGIFTASSAKLTMTQSHVTGNSAGSGGGIGTQGDASIADSRLVGNHATNPKGGFGGGAAFVGSAVVTVVRTLVSGNTSTFGGGGIFNTSALTMANSTISGNNAGVGVGLYLGAPAQLTHVTIAGNSGGFAISGQEAGAAVLTHSLVIGGPFGSTCFEQATDNGYNIDAESGCGFSDPTSQSNIDPMVGLLADNGGQSFTHALLAGSPALNAIPVGTNGCGTAGETDQRGVGFARLSGAGCDIGAYEHQVPPAATATTTVLSISPSTQQYSDKVSLTASVLPASATGTVQFRKSIDGGANFADLGSPVTVANGSAAFNDHQILQAAATAVQFQAVFTATGSFSNSTSDATSLTVTREARPSSTEPRTSPRCRSPRPADRSRLTRSRSCSRSGRRAPTSRPRPPASAASSTRA
jgi:hypothetical protein